MAVAQLSPGRAAPTGQMYRGRIRQGRRVEQHLSAVEPTSAVRREGAVRSVGVNLTGLEVRHKDVPVMIGAVIAGAERNDPCRPCRPLIIEQEKLDQGCALREDAEIDAAGTDCRPKRCACARCNEVVAHLQHGHARLACCRRSAISVIFSVRQVAREGRARLDGRFARTALPVAHNWNPPRKASALSPCRQ